MQINHKEVMELLEAIWQGRANTSGDRVVQDATIWAEETNILVDAMSDEFQKPAKNEKRRFSITMPGQIRIRRKAVAQESRITEGMLHGLNLSSFLDNMQCLFAYGHDDVTANVSTRLPELISFTISKLTSCTNLST